MSTDRLEGALQGMKDETVDAATLDAARGRVWNTLTHAAVDGCAEFRPDLRAYLSGALADGRRLLLEDHVSRCTACRAALADMKGERKVIAMPRRSASPWRRWGALAAAAALVLSVLYVGRDTLDAWMAPGGPRATVVSASGGLYRLTGGAIEAGAAVGEKERIRTGPGAHAALRLADGSIVDVNERTELYVTAAWSGQSIHLQRGDVIVQAAKQRRGHLRVLTRDSMASVKGTVFGVSAGMAGSVVSVVEGSVAVNQPGREVLLRPGEQAASNPALTTTVAQAIAWSPDADQYLQLLTSLARIERQIAPFSGPLRTSSALLSYLPAGAIVYGALPNPGGKIGEGLAAAEQQAFENAAFRAWWSSDGGLELRRIVDRVRSVSSLLGEEVVFTVASAGPNDQVPVVMARVQADKRAALTSALDGLFAEAGESSRPYSVSDDLVLVSDSPSHLAWAVGHLGQGAGSPFAAAIGDRYKRGAGWLIGVDAAPIVAMAGDDAPPVEFAGMTGVKYLFLEQRSPAGAEENEVTVTFQDARKGMASWLADAGSGGAAEYLPADALLAAYVSMRQPGQLFQEFSALVAKQQPSFQTDLAKLEQTLGAGFVANLTGAMGTEVAFALQGFSASGPAWVMVGLANDPAVIDSSLAKLVDTINADLAAAGEPDKRCTLTQESANGRAWTTLKVGGFPFGATWTHDGGYIVAASDRGTAERAIATRNGGSALVWSQTFQRQLPASAGLHPAAFAWLNAKGALGMLSALAPSQAITGLLAEHDPVLVVFDGKPEQIHVASRTRLSGAIVDAMMLESLGRTLTATPSTITRQ
jgi:hypothetical protein